MNPGRYQRSGPLLHNNTIERLPKPRAKIGCPFGASGVASTYTRRFSPVGCRGSRVFRVDTKLKLHHFNVQRSGDPSSRVASNSAEFSS